MDTRFKRLTAAAGVTASLVIASSLFGASTASAAPCATGSVGTYTSPGFSCSVGPLTFSNFTVSATAGGSASVVLGNFNPDIVNAGGHTEYGFSLSYSSNAFGLGSVSTADVVLTYDVTSAPGSMVDAYMAYTGGSSGIAITNLAETLSNGSSMLLLGPGATSTTFAPINSLQAIKDQDDAAFLGDAFSSVLVDGFSVTGVPEPGAIALLGAGLLGGAVFLRRRRLLNFFR